MLVDSCCKQYMVLATGQRCISGLIPIYSLRRDIRSTYSSVITAYKSADKIIQPIGINHAVRIGVGEDFTLSCGRAGIPGVAQSLIALMNVTHPWELRCDIRCIIGRSVIDQDDLILGIVKFT